MYDDDDVCMTLCAIDGVLLTSLDLLFSCILQASVTVGSIA